MVDGVQARSIEWPVSTIPAGVAGVSLMKKEQNSLITIRCPLIIVSVRPAKNNYTTSVYMRPCNEWKIYQIINGIEIDAAYRIIDRICTSLPLVIAEDPLKTGVSLITE